MKNVLGIPRSSIKVGDEYGSLLIVSEEGVHKFKGRLVKYRCKTCGREKIVRVLGLRTCKSCAVAGRDGFFKHGHAGNIHGKSKNPISKDIAPPSKTYRSWDAMLSSCYAPAYVHRSIQIKGIKVCESWRKSFQKFLEDMGEKPEGTRLTRLDKNADFTPENCIWKKGN